MSSEASGIRSAATAGTLAILLAATLIVMIHRSRSRIARCAPNRITDLLEPRPQPPLSTTARFLAFGTTPIKSLGIHGWTDTGCWATGFGQLVRDAQHSTDGFYTIDVELHHLAIDSIDSNLTKRYIRIEVEPGTDAHNSCTSRGLKARDEIGFEGRVVIDRDGPFLEIHPQTLQRFAETPNDPCP